MINWNANERTMPLGDTCSRSTAIEMFKKYNGVPMVATVDAHSK